MGVLTFLVVSIPSVWFLWQREKREARQQEAQRQRLVTEAENLFGKARRSLWMPRENPEEENPEEMFLTAAEKYSEAAELTPQRKEKCKLWVEVGRCYEAINWLHEAEQAYCKAVQNWSKHPEAWRRLAVTQRGLLKEQEALHSLKQHLESNPSDKEAQWLLNQWQA